MLNDLAEAIRRWTGKSAEARSLHESKHGMQRQEQKVLGFFFRPTPCGFRQVVQQLSKPAANEINYLIHAGADAVVAAKVNWNRTDT